MVCDIQKCGCTSWVEAFFAIEGKRKEYLYYLKQDIDVYRKSDELLRLIRIGDPNAKQKAVDESLKVTTFFNCFKNFFEKRVILIYCFYFLIRVRAQGNF